MILKSATDALQNRIPDVSRFVDNVEVLSSSLPYNPRITLVQIQVGRDVFPELTEHRRASGKVQSGETLVIDNLTNNLRSGSWNKLNDTRRNTSLSKNLVNNVIRIDGHG